MTIIEIQPLDNGGHRNQTYHGILPDGWAVLPMDTGTLENFPYGIVEVDNSEVPTVTSWEALSIPEPEQEPTEDETLNTISEVVAE